jgi:spermidine/putrescine-binding protein
MWHEDFVSRPAREVELGCHTRTNANLAATPLLDASIASNTLIYPTRDQQQRLFAKTEVSSEQSRTITRIWQRFKTGQ